MIQRTVLLALVAFAACQTPETDTTPSSMYLQVETLDDGLVKWVGDSVEATLLAEGFDWSEGPLWLENEKMLLFSDVPENTVYAWSEDQGLTTYLNPSGYTGSIPRTGEMGSNGLILDNSGNLVLCQHGDRRIARMLAPLEDPVPDFETIAGTYEGRPFNSPNDIVTASDGRFYFTDPPYGLENAAQDQQIPWQGVYSVSPDGNVHLLTDSVTRPNGIALSPDERTLYVGNSDSSKPWWIAYPLEKPDSLGQGKILVDASALYTGARGPDGMVVAKDGTIISSGFEGVWFIRPDGTVLGRILIEGPVSNTTIDQAEEYLYVTNDNRILRIPLGAGE